MLTKVQDQQGCFEGLCEPNQPVREWFSSMVHIHFGLPNCGLSDEYLQPYAPHPRRHQCEHLLRTFYVQSVVPNHLACTMELLCSSITCSTFSSTWPSAIGLIASTLIT